MALFFFLWLYKTAIKCDWPLEDVLPAIGKSSAEKFNDRILKCVINISLF